MSKKNYVDTSQFEKSIVKLQRLTHKAAAEAIKIAVTRSLPKLTSFDEVEALPWLQNAPQGAVVITGAKNSTAISEAETFARLNELNENMLQAMKKGLREAVKESGFA